MANERHLLVPIKAQALVIDDIVITRSGAVVVDGKYRANAGRWSPLQSDYQSVSGSLSAPGPIPFYGATRKYQGKAAEQLVLDANSRALPKPADRGVYLHWVLPSGLRHAYEPGSLDFPALPDQWLIVRFCRRGAAALQTRAWFVDSGLVTDSDDDPANILLEGGAEYEARRVGKVVPLDEFTPAEFAGDHKTITAIGNAQTGSPTFTAFLAENRNVLSWHDTLNDLREPVNTGKVPNDTSLSYLLLGWYLNPWNEPLKALPVELVKQESPKPSGWLIEPLGWLVESAQAPGDLKSHRSFFHGMVAHINYWSSNTYKGPMLGYPGSPAVAGTLGGSPPAFKVGVGNNAEDALVSLVSSEYSGGETAPNLWKALEAVIYRQPESLVGSWNAAPRDHTVHQSWFSTLEAGQTWSIRPRSGNESTFPSDPKVTAAQTGTSATPDQLADLKHLNKLQSEMDAASRELAALQQDLYARWWKLCERSRLDDAASLKSEEADCRALIARVKTLQSDREKLLKQLRPPDALPLVDALKKKLRAELELRSDDAPRFWAPSDPVIVVMNCGKPAKHTFPTPLPCRLTEQIVSAGEVEIKNNEKKTFDNASGITEITSSVRKQFGEHSEILTSLLTEGSVVEQAISDLAHRTYESLPPNDRVFDAGRWWKWTTRLVDDLNWGYQSNNRPTDRIVFGKPGALNIQPHRLAELWVQQPWSPLFLDWQITWFPTTQSGQDFGPVWSLGEHGHDYKPLDRRSLPTTGFTFRGRSLLNPIDGRLFDEPLETLKQLLRGDDGQRDKGKPSFPAAVVQILKKYEDVWDQTLGKLSGAGLMGQALSGFHQSLLRRDVTLPRVMPDPKHPWVFRSRLKDLELEVGRLLDSSIEGSLVGERLAPPALPPSTPELPFSMVRAGALRIDELWLVDDFGQWADLLGLTPSGSTSSGQVFNPRMRWHEDSEFIAMPPRITQPARLNFRFTAAENSLAESDSDPALGPICGWIFYNPLDRALVLCDKNGRLSGELVIRTEQTEFCIDWDPGARGVALDKILNPALQAFAKSLVAEKPSPRPRLLDLLTLIDRALERIRPAAARRDGALFGHPLALVSAHLGLELFGKSWTDPRRTPVAAPLENAGDATLNALRVRVNLGCAHNTEDGLVGYFKAGAYDRIVPAELAKKIDSTGYIADSATAAVRIGFGPPEQLTLLMDPWGSVQAAAGLVPAKSITLAQANLDRTLAQMEASFRVGPVLLQSDRLAMPMPAGDKRLWSFSGPLTNNLAAALAPSDPRYFSDHPVVAAEGRLLLLNKEE